MFPLSSLNEGQQGKIVKIMDCEGKRCFQKNENGKKCSSGRGNRMTRIADLGLRVGKIVELLKKGTQGPALIKVDEARIAIGRGMADKILITDI